MNLSPPKANRGAYLNHPIGEERVMEITRAEPMAAGCGVRLLRLDEEAKKAFCCEMMGC